MSTEERKSTKSVGSMGLRMSEASTKSRQPQQSKIGHSSKKVARGFIEFLKDHTIVTLAVGFVIATQVQDLVKQLVSSFITPTFQFFFSGALAKDNISFHLNGRSVTYSWGLFISDLLDFLFVVGAIYLIIKLFKLDKLEAKK